MTVHFKELGKNTLYRLIARFKEVPANKTKVKGVPVTGGEEKVFNGDAVQIIPETPDRGGFFYIENHNSPELIEGGR